MYICTCECSAVLISFLRPSLVCIWFGFSGVLFSITTNCFLWATLRLCIESRALNFFMRPNETYTKFVYFVIDKTDNDTDLSHFFLQSWTTACASSFQSSTCNSDIFRIQKKNNWRTNTMNFVLRLKFLSASLENTQKKTKE